MGTAETDQPVFEAITPNDKTTVSRFALAARQSGYDGIILRHCPTGPGETNLAAIEGHTGVTIHQGHTVVAGDRSQTGSEIARYRNKTDVLFGEATSAKRRHFLAGQHRLDVLRMDVADASEISHTTIARAADNGVYIEFDLANVLRATGKKRINDIEILQTLHRIIENTDTPFVVSGVPKSHFELRGPRELAAVVDGIGVPGKVVTIGMRAWGSILERTERNRDDTFIEPGVEYLPNETDN